LKKKASISNICLQTPKQFLISSILESTSITSMQYQLLQFSIQKFKTWSAVWCIYVFSHQKMTLAVKLALWD